jgi:hypothetical protein
MFLKKRMATLNVIFKKTLRAHSSIKIAESNCVRFNGSHDKLVSCIRQSGKSEESGDGIRNMAKPLFHLPETGD